MSSPDIAVYSGSDSEERRAAVKQAGADHYFIKLDEYEALMEWMDGQNERVVVVVDDDEALLAQTQIALELAGATVYCFTNPVEALEEIPSINPDSILTDVDMPGMTGIELTAKLREIYPPSE